MPSNNPPFSPLVTPCVDRQTLKESETKELGFLSRVRSQDRPHPNQSDRTGNQHDRPLQQAVTGNSPTSPETTSDAAQKNFADTVPDTIIPFDEGKTKTQPAALKGQ